MNNWISFTESDQLLAVESGDWDGKRTDYMLVATSDGNVLKARAYVGFLDGGEFCNWFTENDSEVIGVTHFQELPNHPSLCTFKGHSKVDTKLRVSHFPQIPCEPFYVGVKDEEQAFLVSEALANQHLFLYDNGIIPDYNNSILVEMLDYTSDGNEWVDYYNDLEGMDFEEFTEAYLINN